ncbi:formamidopyrimidine-DNA glycosylase [Rhodoblastus acidophilus]|uniref:bifunctional DNA-formamidopyrimidine glycosylase/DNA-(apurinic or apyrimidinic site) lyase n=1 Tax=Rhodoblastus acidophilus TaxID=1074 RepID=UPI002224F2C4|nr:bifunctional DNA-formamidopyrimidine glycosylase/DNA-(apurinic or apyrimidinic site) lyase [Rhodoblastus acidophilus]MCW2284262.1 formamidopyrimidine-DNA glycosylase [Rhodoblastus acidophilus]MCW2334693.1 formamidopyrimidine-DNA glycosylase [Rhodoblastus acidophilus]
MPELPEVETVRQGLAPFLVGSRILQVDLRRKDLRFPFPENFSTRLEGRRIVALNRRAKYLLAHLDDEQVLVAHLGMSGSFRLEAGTVGTFKFPRSKNPAHDHVAFSLETGVMIYNDPRRFGFMTLAQSSELADHPYFVGLGVEPLSNDFSGESLNQLFAGKSAPLKSALLDQRNIAGLGNIYVCEALHRAKLSPMRPAGSLTEKASDTLARAVRQVLQEAIEAGGSSLRDHRQADGSLGYFQHNFRVYDREGQACVSRACQGTITRRTQNGRSTFYCPNCQS